MALNLTDNWQMAKILTDNWHLYPAIQTLLTDVLSKERELTDNWKETKVIKDLSPNDLNRGLFLRVYTAFATTTVSLESYPSELLREFNIISGA